MLKVLIVDDELLVRIGLKTIIPWEDNGFYIVGDASNGIEALEICQKTKPHIVITDIKMPKMDGIELSRKLKELDKKIKVIILTCYNEFDYAKEAISLGASDYVVKSTMEPEDLLGILYKIRKEIEAEIKDSEEKEKLKREVQNQKKLVKQKILMDIFNGLYDDDKQINNILKEIDVELPYSNYCGIYFKVDDINSRYRYMSPDNKRLLRDFILNIGEEMMGKRYPGVIVEVEEGAFACLLSINKSMGSSMEIVKSLAIRIQTAVFNYAQISISAAISAETQFLKDISTIFNKLKMLIKYKVFFGRKCIITENDVSVDEKASVENYKFNEEELLFYIKEGNREGVRNTINRIFYSLENEKPSLSRLNYVIIQLISVLNKVSQHTETMSAEQNLYEYFTVDEVLKLETLEEIWYWFENQFDLLVVTMQEYKYYSGSAITRRAVDYILQNYMRDISLGDVAAHVNISRTYFSRIFKNEMGENFVDYLARVRIEKAKEYLLFTDLKTYEVAEKVGFQDSGYFSKMFKKIVGVTPSEFKRQNK